ncbi:SUN domain-containing protein 2-like [Cynoglossus semilaevis]|uniref:SUN domain-containing protein 2-like n=1 Tax=Cynoglossus semilaevis TaxID=244447 RepID=UPI000494EDBC|nr:SUN domain-containing protein 2-like [Cynoglossus semilaevis]
MSRRSSRLLSSGYYSDEGEDTSGLANITYRENPVKVFRRRAGGRKPRSHTCGTADAKASASGHLPLLTAGQSVGLSPPPLAYPTGGKCTKMTFGLSLIITVLIHLFLFHSLFTLCKSSMCITNNPAVGAVEVKMRHLFSEMQREQAQLHSQMMDKIDQEIHKHSRPVADNMADFALESQGAKVINSRTSQTYNSATLFGIPLWNSCRGPHTVIQGNSALVPGKCWPFEGAQGSLAVSLFHPVKITHVTLDHLPRYNSPTGRIDSAPRDFEVYGMKSDGEGGALLGIFTYDENGESTQTFRLPFPTDDAYKLVELRVLSNWGHVQYTCLYRFRVHGNVTSNQEQMQC